jgi:thiaminase/transcriptional activator TenA
MAGFFDQLRTACSLEWEAYCQHEFVQALGRGTLSEDCFKHYLVQDYLFLIHFARAWALAVFKAETLEEMRDFTSVLHALLEQEMALHVDFCAGWGISRAEMEKAPEAKANMAYTRFVLERGMAGDLLDLLVALSPCVIGYGDIGRDLARSDLSSNPYRAWVETYAGEDYQLVARQAENQIERLWQSRGTAARREALIDTFRKATILEAGFWDMALERSE